MRDAAAAATAVTSTEPASTAVMSHGSYATAGWASPRGERAQVDALQHDERQQGAQQRADDHGDDGDGADLPGHERLLAAATEAQRGEQRQQAIPRRAPHDEREHDRERGEQARQHDRGHERRHEALRGRSPGEFRGELAGRDDGRALAGDRRERRR